MNLKLLGLFLSLALFCLYVPILLRPARSTRCLLAFPRWYPAGVALAAINLIWAGWHLRRIPLPWLEPVVPLMGWLVAIAFVAVVFFLRDLLAARMLGGLLLLIPAEMLVHARFHASTLRYVIIMLAYVMVIKGMLLVCYPYMFRHWVQWLKREPIVRLAGGVGVLFAASLLLISLIYY